MKSLRKLMFWTIALVVLCGCGMFQFRHQSVDPFYSDYSDWDLIRFPLIKPYEAEQLDEEHGWAINLPISFYENGGILFYSDIYYPEKVAVNNNVIMVYTTYIPLHLRSSDENVLYWFVLLPEEKRETGFTNEADFLKFIKRYGIDKPDWQAMDAAFHQFRETGCLAWIPDCK